LAWADATLWRALFFLFHPFSSFSPLSRSLFLLPLISIYNTCQDSLLATPLILDLAILAELMTRVTYRDQSAKSPEFEKLYSVLGLLSYMLKVRLPSFLCTKRSGTDFSDNDDDPLRRLPLPSPDVPPSTASTVSVRLSRTSFALAWRFSLGAFPCCFSSPSTLLTFLVGAATTLSTSPRSNRAFAAPSRDVRLSDRLQREPPPPLFVSSSFSFLVVPFFLPLSPMQHYQVQLSSLCHASLPPGPRLAQVGEESMKGRK
jgi:hypothetical protein